MVGLRIGRHSALAAAGSGRLFATHVLVLSRQKSEWRSLLAVAICGWIIDSALIQFGVLHMANTAWLPLWLALLWLAFATTVGYSLQWTATPWWLGSVLGAIAGPLSYWAGARLAGVELPLGHGPSVALLGLVWALAMPLLHWVWRSSRRA